MKRPRFKVTSYYQTSKSTVITADSSQEAVDRVAAKLAEQGIEVTFSRVTPVVEEDPS